MIDKQSLMDYQQRTQELGDAKYNPFRGKDQDEKEAE
jgi:hypothetical protein